MTRFWLDRLCGITPGASHGATLPFSHLPPFCCRETAAVSTWQGCWERNQLEREELGLWCSAGSSAPSPWILIPGRAELPCPALGTAPPSRAPFPLTNLGRGFCPLQSPWISGQSLGGKTQPINVTGRLQLSPHPTDTQTSIGKMSTEVIAAADEMDSSCC